MTAVNRQLQVGEFAINTKKQSLSELNSPAMVEARVILEDLTVVIPTLGRPILEQSLACILNGSMWPGRLIIVDQGRNLNVAKWLEQFESNGILTSHINSDQRGRARGINRGLEQLQTRFVAITDDDCFVETDWLENLWSSLNENPHSIITGRVEAAGEGTLITVTSRTPAIYTRPRLKFDAMSGGNMGTSQAVIQKVGLFDEDSRLATAEDAEWSYRALRSGISIIYNPDVCVLHYDWRDQGQKIEQFRSYAKSHGGFYGKYLRRGDMFIFLRAGVHIFRALRRWVYGKIIGNADLALYGKAYFLGLPLGMVAGFRSVSGSKAT